METIAQVVTMKTLISALLAVLLLSGCAVNKPLPVESVMLAGMEFVPVNLNASFDVKCNSFNELHHMNVICLGGGNGFFAMKMYDSGRYAFEKNRVTDTNAILDEITKTELNRKSVIIKTENPEYLIFKWNNSTKYSMLKVDYGTGFLSYVLYIGANYKDKLPIIDKILADLKNYSPRLGSKQ